MSFLWRERNSGCRINDDYTYRIAQFSPEAEITPREAEEGSQWL